MSFRGRGRGRGRARENPSFFDAVWSGESEQKVNQNVDIEMKYRDNNNSNSSSNININNNNNNNNNALNAFISINQRLFNNEENRIQEEAKNVIVAANAAPAVLKRTMHTVEEKALVRFVISLSKTFNWISHENAYDWNSYFLLTTTLQNINQPNVPNPDLTDPQIAERIIFNFFEQPNFFLQYALCLIQSRIMMKNVYRREVTSKPVSLLQIMKCSAAVSHYLELTRLLLTTTRQEINKNHATRTQINLRYDQKELEIETVARMFIEGLIQPDKSLEFAPDWVYYLNENIIQIVYAIPAKEYYRSKSKEWLILVTQACDLQFDSVVIPQEDRANADITESFQGELKQAVGEMLSELSLAARQTTGSNKWMDYPIYLLPFLINSRANRVYSAKLVAWHYCYSQAKHQTNNFNKKAINLSGVEKLLLLKYFINSFI